MVDDERPEEADEEWVVRSSEAEPEAGADCVAVDGGSLDGVFGASEDGADEGVEGDELPGEADDGGHESPGPHGDADVDSLTDGEGLSGGRVFSSRWVSAPLCRAIHSLLSGSKMTNTSMTVFEGATTTTFCGR